jgi:phosphoesterase RecJ-like protein
MLEQIKLFWDLLKSSKRVMLINHIRMDMDAFWSLSAMYELIEKLWKKVKAINDELLPSKFAFLWYNNIIEPDLDVKKFNPDLIICLDTANLERLWKSYENNKEIFNKTNFVVIDHHITNPKFWNINIINLEYSSTCELVYEILVELNYQKYISPKMATAILSWIYTDTNIFYNSNTWKNTYLVTSKLIEYWADYRTPYYELYKKKTLAQTKLWWEIIINHMKISENWKLVWATVPETTFKKVWAEDRDLEWLISEFFACIQWVEVCFISHEISDNTIKTGFRSTHNYDVSLISSNLWWWWHKQASWYSSEKTLKEVETEILREIEKEFWF